MALVTEAVAKEVLTRIESGQTTLAAERKRLGLKSTGPIRRALVRELGSEEAVEKTLGGKQPKEQEATKPSALQMLGRMWPDQTYWAAYR